MTSCAKPFEHTNEKSINNIIFIENLFKGISLSFKDRANAKFVTFF